MKNTLPAVPVAKVLEAHEHNRLFKIIKASYILYQMKMYSHFPCNLKHG